MVAEPSADEVQAIGNACAMQSGEDCAEYWMFVPYCERSPGGKIPRIGIPNGSTELRGWFQRTLATPDFIDEGPQVDGHAVRIELPAHRYPTCLPHRESNFVVLGEGHQVFCHLRG